MFAACFDRGEELETGIRGQLTVGPGVVFIERGPVHEGTFERAGLIAEDGSYSVTVTGGGTYGFHTYVENYIYIPMQVEVEEGKWTTLRQQAVDWDFLCDSGGNCDWVEQPPDDTRIAPQADSDLTDNPVLSNIQVTQVAADAFQLSVEVNDPEGDLSNQILAHHVGSGLGVQLNPPGPIIAGNYPNGVYTATVFLAEGANPAGIWQFVAADHECSNSPVLDVEPD